MRGAAGWLAVAVAVLHAQSAAAEEWTRIAKCAPGSSNRRDYTVAEIMQLAQTATRVKICTTNSTTDCAVSVAGTFPIQMLRLGWSISHNYNSYCDTSCVASTWTGPRVSRMWSTCYQSTYAGPGAVLGSNTQIYPALYHCCNNQNGLYISLGDAQTCTWDWTASTDPSNTNLEIFLDVPTPVEAPYSQYTEGGLQYYLVALTNGQRTYGPGNTPWDPYIDTSDKAVGEYVKPLYGTSIRLRYECGYKSQGVLGFLELQGSWTWQVGGNLTADGNITKVAGNAIWEPQLPGWAGDGDGSAPWSNANGSTRTLNFGTEGFRKVDGNVWVMNGAAESAFACDPQNSVVGSARFAWAPSSTSDDVKYVRLWLATPTTTTTTATSSTSTITTTVSTTTTTTVSTTTSTATVSTTTSSTRSTTTSTTTVSTTTSSTVSTTTTTTLVSTTTTTTSTTTLTIYPMGDAVDDIVIQMLQQLPEPNVPATLSRAGSSAVVIVSTAAAGATALGGAYRHFSVRDVLGQSVQVALPWTAALGWEKVALVSYASAAAFSEGGVHADFYGVESPALSIRVWGQKGGFIPLAGLPLSQPVRLFLPRNRTLHPDLACAFWDSSAGRWSSQGLSEGNSTEDHLVCESAHLTIFAAVLRAILDQLQCTNIEVLAPDLLKRIDRRWPARAPGVGLWVLLACSISWVVYGLWVDARATRSGLWQDSCYVTYLPEHRRTPLGLGYCAFIAGSWIGVCRALATSCWLCSSRRPKRSQDFAGADRKWVVTRITVTAVQSIVASWHGLVVEDVREHVWGPRGFVQVQVARQSSGAMCHKLDGAQAAVPAAFCALFEMSACRRFGVLLDAAHPLSGVGRFSTTLSAAKRGKLMADALLGALVINALFFSATASAMSVRSPAACAGERLNPIRFILIGVVSSLLVKLPLGLLAHMHLRVFVHEEHWGPNTTEVQLRRWRCMDAWFWVLGLAWSGFCIFFLMAFLANLNSKDDAKWIIAFVSVVLRMMIVGPAALALTLTVAVELLALLNPGFVRHGDPRLGFEPRPAAAQFKVGELARRSMSIGDLLDFYALLGTKEVMPHFNPGESTTHDVVRQAIIPLSCRADLPGGGVAYATLVAKGEVRVANKMVTHNWGNKFSHLLAAIMADCLGHRTYASCLGYLLRGPSGVAELRAKMQANLHRTYWVCAFCVNQHAGICAQAPPADSTGAPIQTCTCPHPKYTSGEDCEMNKFDDMMMHLKAISPGFMQVVAVDSEFVVFNRIWCVAEILGAFHMQLPQTLKIESAALVDKRKDELQAFDVRMAQSSVPEDKDLILSKVEDKDAFNNQLKELVLDPVRGLLAVWSAAGIAATAASAVLEEGGSVILQQAVDLLV